MIECIECEEMAMMPRSSEVERSPVKRDVACSNHAEAAN